MIEPGASEAHLPAVEVTELRKTYGGRAVVDGLSFSVARGEVLAVVGPNGAGKTTTIEILEGYRRPDSGTVRVLGRDPVRDGRKVRPRIGVMLQEGGVYPGIRALEAVELFAAYYPDPVSPSELLSSVGLQDVARTTVRRLSGGERQRLSLALAVVGRPEVAFLDEPTAGMDPRGRASTWDVVARLRAGGTAVVLTTHAMDEAEALADRVAIIDRGRLAALGTPTELADAPGEEVWFRAPAGLDTGALASDLGLPGGSVSEAGAGRYRIATPADPALVAGLAAWLQRHGMVMAELQTGRASLEEVFLRLTAEPSAAEEER